MRLVVSKHIHILGICGTFMGGLALIARELGYRVSGSDANVYPPMSTQLEASGITLHEGYDPSVLDPAPDLVIVGNAMTRGNAVIESLLNSTIPYTSGPEWLGREVLRDRWVLAVAGTHGKTTTSSILAWMLECAGLEPGFLIGGVTANFGVSARLGQAPFFVIEADEYDTAFFDKRSKFIHYHPRTLIFNNLEFDHADIFDSLADIERQFHHLIRILPSQGLVIHPVESPSVERVLAKGVWSETLTFGSSNEASWVFSWKDRIQGQFAIESASDRFAGDSPLRGDYNLSNITAAMLAARHAGVQPETALNAVQSFRNTKRRQEVLFDRAGITVVDDFAHHPTAIEVTLAGLRDQYPGRRLVLVLEPRSNTMRMGVHADTLANATRLADERFWLTSPQLRWELTPERARGLVFPDSDTLLSGLLQHLMPGDVIVCMSNGDFQGFKPKLLRALEEHYV